MLEGMAGVVGAPGAGAAVVAVAPAVPPDVPPEVPPGDDAPGTGVAPELATGLEIEGIFSFCPTLITVVAMPLALTISSTDTP